LFRTVQIQPKTAQMRLFLWGWNTAALLGIDLQKRTVPVMPQDKPRTEAVRRISFLASKFTSHAEAR
jgi:hypothetical protein